MVAQTVRLSFLSLLLRLSVYLFRHNHPFRQLCGLAYVCAMMDDSEVTRCLCKQACTMKYEV